MSARVVQGADEMREAIGYYMFQHQETWRSLCSPEDADWEEWVERNREEWRQEADALLSGPLAQLLAERDELRAKVARVRELIADWDCVPTSFAHMQMIRRALAGI